MEFDTYDTRPGNEAVLFHSWLELPDFQRSVSVAVTAAVAVAVAKYARITVHP